MDTITTSERDKSQIRFDPLSPDYLADPYPFLSAAAKAAPAFYCEAIDHWVVTRYHDIRHIFRTPALFSAGNANSPLRPVCPMATKALDDGGFKSVPTLANVDPPAHTRVRKIANVAFTPKRVAEMEPFVRDLTVRFCEVRLRDGRADIVRDLAWALPALVLFRILGVPDDEVPRVKEGSWSSHPAHLWSANRGGAGARRRGACSVLAVRGKPRSRSHGEAAPGLCERFGAC